MTSFTTLVAAKSDLNSIRAWVNHGDVPAESIVSEAQAFIYSKLRTRELRKRITGSIISGVSNFAIPSGYLASLRLRVVHPVAGIMPLKQLPWHDHEDMLVIAPDGSLPVAMPQFFATDADQVYLNTVTDAALSYRWWIYQTPAPLSSTNKDNFLTTKYPHILDSTCRSLAQRYWRSANEADTWLKIALDGIETANQMADQELSDMISENDNA
jgi:hypothetical protein